MSVRTGTCAFVDWLRDVHHRYQQKYKFVRQLYILAISLCGCSSLTGAAVQSWAQTWQRKVETKNHRHTHGKLTNNNRDLDGKIEKNCYFLYITSIRLQRWIDSGLTNLTTTPLSRFLLGQFTWAELNISHNNNLLCVCVYQQDVCYPPQVTAMLRLSGIHFLLPCSYMASRNSVS